ncbi:DUF305 domain-containing protein [Jiangella asiatica]|uniref:DUF305 domain-containing protein n=1 Tax=Jiangella asiatica TaxID=2530372 RepID=A0A4R5DFR2_9ACTN|nr:DUF305 domain-containing protein [Jiangella asiatica]TDE12619.1 DUF305 domain-containing protein [Jiangella asiatica]
MYRKRFTLPIVGAVAAGVLLAGCGADGDEPAAGASTGTSVNQSGVDQADVDFAQQMIAHHVQAVQMAQLVPDQGVGPGLIQVADAVEAAQQPEIEQLTAMLERWGEDPASTDDPHAGHHGGGMEGMMTPEDLSALEAATGVEFERMWLTMMIEHHRGAIAMSETQLADGTDAEARALAQAIIDAQSAEIEQLEQLLAAIPS